MDTVAFSCASPPPGVTQRCNDMGRPDPLFNGFTLVVAIVVVAGVVSLFRIFRGT